MRQPAENKARSGRAPLDVLIDQEMLVELRRAATENDRTLSGEVRWRLKESLARDRESETDHATA